MFAFSILYSTNQWVLSALYQDPRFSLVVDGDTISWVGCLASLTTASYGPIPLWWILGGDVLGPRSIFSSQRRLFLIRPSSLSFGMLLNNMLLPNNNLEIFLPFLTCLLIRILLSGRPVPSLLLSFTCLLRATQLGVLSVWLHPFMSPSSLCGIRTLTRLFFVCTYSCMWQLQLSLRICRGLVLGSPVDTKMLRFLMLNYHGI